MYSMRAVCTVRPHPHGGMSRTVDHARLRRTTANTATTPMSRPRVSISGERPAWIPARCTYTPLVEIGAPSAMPVAGAIALSSGFASRVGSSASAMQTPARAIMPVRIVIGDSRAASASADLGIARKADPNALTKAAAASPPVSTTTATATGIATATEAASDGRL